mmetsp:Transcript_112374/g.223291  ORF Transcript_112374/g.223291 Transcript_112374/m.223291 type:complete len:118 (-) Transcript_112374:386-739(-)
MVLQMQGIAISALAFVLAVWHSNLMRAGIEPQPLQASSTPQDVVGRLETCAYDEHIFGDEDGRLYPGECTICLGTWEPLDRIKVTPCQHAFHENCLVSWLTTASTCALCRRDLSELA